MNARGYDCAGEGIVEPLGMFTARHSQTQTKPIRHRQFLCTNMLSSLLFLFSSSVLLVTATSTHVRGGLLSLEPGAITHSDCKQITPANKDVYWSSMEIAKGGTGSWSSS